MKDRIELFTGKYDFLSNFYLHPVEYEGVVYPSTEHAYQAAKTLEPETREYIATLETPGKAKKAGKLVNMRPDWNDTKVIAMYEICSIKFRDPALRQKLLETGNSDLIEGNYWHDNIWGVCNCKKCPGSGNNWLGRILMKIRFEIRAEILKNENQSK